MLSNKIYELRKNKNISQEELAEILNTSRQAISKWERGEASPDIDKLKDLATYFNVSIDYLLEYDLESISVNNFINRLQKAMENKQYDISEEEIKMIVLKNSNNFSLLLYVVYYLFESKSLDLITEYTFKCIKIFQPNNSFGVTIDELKRIVVLSYVMKEEYLLAKNYIEEQGITNCDIELAECEINLGNVDKTNEIVSKTFLKSIITLIDNIYVQIQMLLKMNSVLEAYDLVNWGLSFVKSIRKDENLFFECVYYLNLYKLICEHHLKLDFLSTLNYIKDNSDLLFMNLDNTESLKYYGGEQVFFFTALSDIKTTLKQGLKMFKDTDVFEDISFIYDELYGGDKN